MSEPSKIYQKLRAARLRLEGGGKLSEQEQKTIDTLNSEIALAMFKNNPPISLAMQSLSEMLLSALANTAKTPEEFYKNVYTFVKDFLFPQADLIKQIILDRHNEIKQMAKDNPGEISKKFTDRLKGAVVVQGDNIEQVLDQLEQIVKGEDNCDCSACVERRLRQAGSQINEPKSPTKH